MPDAARNHCGRALARLRDTKKPGPNIQHSAPACCESAGCQPPADRVTDPIRTLGDICLERGINHRLDLGRLSGIAGKCSVRRLLRHAAYKDPDCCLNNNAKMLL
jgi:hypothetical protein